MKGSSTSALEFQLLNEYQQRFPLCNQPFSDIADTLGSTQEQVLEALARLKASDHISRIGAVFAPQRIGASTLAALSVPSEQLAGVAAMVNQFPEVNHNYEREHRFNLWFVVTARSIEQLNAVLAEIERRSGLVILRLPLLEQYHIDLGFKLDQTRHSPKQTRLSAGAAMCRSTPAKSEPWIADGKNQALVNALQGGLPLIPRPYHQLALQVGCSESEVQEHIQRWLDSGILKRFGVVVRHHELGYTANAMVVHDIPDELVQQLGHAIGQHPGVTLCYQRPRFGTEWPYNLFCMLHGRERAEVERQIAELRSTHGLQGYAFDILFSRTRYKQQGAYYANGTPTIRAPSAVEA